MLYIKLKYFAPFFLLFAWLIMASHPVYAEFKETEAEALVKAQQDMKNKINRISMFHHAARSSMTESLQIPMFKDYFNLPESQSYRVDNLGQIELTQKQNKIRAQMEEWILTLHSRFPIGETCLIDNHGQEHLRVVGGQIKPPHMFSSEEHGAPFFTPTFDLKEGEVYISEPYFSEDSLFWVTAFTSPIYLEDKSIPGFYHFEVPLAAYSDLISFKEFSFAQFKGNELDTEEEGRYFIIDENSLVIADSELKINFNLPDERNHNINEDLPDYMPPEKLADYTTSFSRIFPDKGSAEIAKKMQTQREGTLYLNILGRDYLMIFQPVPDRPDWIIAHLDPIGGHGYWDLNIIKP